MDTRSLIRFVYFRPRAAFLMALSGLLVIVLVSSICNILPRPLGKQVIVITPTFGRPIQIPLLTSLGATLKIAGNIFWVVVEDAANRSKAVEAALLRSGVRHAYLTEYTEKQNGTYFHKGLKQRNAALAFIELHRLPGHFVFGDDDNIFDPILFKYISQADEPDRVSMYPVGLVGRQGFEGPLLNEEKQITGFASSWASGHNRTFQIDMAGFAVPTSILHASPGEHRFLASVPRGWMEDQLLVSLIGTFTEARPLLPAWERPLVWHMPPHCRIPISQDHLTRSAPAADSGDE